MDMCRNGNVATCMNYQMLCEWKGQKKMDAAFIAIAKVFGII